LTVARHVPPVNHTETSVMTTGTRELTFLLAEPEKRLLKGVAARLPRWITSDHLTLLGVLGSVAVGAGYALTSYDIRWLWLASGALIVNWLGDSLDGTLARVRQVERPRYGYYLDHLVDAFSTAVIGVGIGLSPFVRIEVALLLVVAYLALSINVYLETAVFGVFKLSYGRIGPTEARLILIALNLLLLLSTTLGGRALAQAAALSNAVSLLLALAMGAMLVARSVSNLSHLARLEPLNRP
jgi:phosphatidylglycerophosphate synthase